MEQVKAQLQEDEIVIVQDYEVEKQLILKLLTVGEKRQEFCLMK